MKYRDKVLFSLMTAVVSIIGCSKEAMPTENYIDDDLAPYFDLFIEEGRIRGLDEHITTALVSGVLEEIEEDGVSGQCRHAQSGVDRVVIDPEFWNSATELKREFLVFHELGHCLLGRGHLDEKDQRGICMSIMHSGSSACRNAYNSNNRKEYLDELFSY